MPATKKEAIAMVLGEDVRMGRGGLIPMRSVILILLWCLGGCGDNSETPATDALTIDASSADAPTTDANGPVGLCNEFPGVARVGTWRTLSTSGGPTTPGGTDTLVASDTEI